jgi:uncharacterized repeat protein (TIGR03803 family)
MASYDCYRPLIDSHHHFLWKVCGVSLGIEPFTHKAFDLYSFKKHYDLVNLTFNAFTGEPVLSRLLFIFSAIILGVLISGCGGGSSSGDPAPTPTPTPTPALTYTVGGTINGLTSGSLILQNNGGDALSISANSSTFTFTTPLASGATYAVTASSVPAGLTCTVSNGTGTVSANVSSIIVTCSVNSYTIGGTVSGLASGTSFTVQDNSTNSQLITSNGAFTFTTPLASGTPYVVSVSYQPILQSCVVTNGSGTITGSNITNANIVCTSGVNESILYSFDTAFGTATYGRNPFAGLIQDASGNLYGTTEAGGSSGNNGTVFKVTPAGIETVIYSFSGADGQTPNAALIQDASGNLYGTTYFGGTSGTGTVFKVTPAGVETVLHSFANGGSGGQNPQAGLLLDVSGNLYGTTRYGGTTNNGTVFKVNPAGVTTVLYSFTGADGQYPQAGLIQDANGNLYGTTNSGGTSSKGTVFKVTPAGVETVLHSFSGADGQNPMAGLIQDANGNLYGTTSSGGTNSTGTVFKVTPTGGMTTLYSFGTGTSDGWNPRAGLIQDASGNLYGTTYRGGTNDTGTVFKITP